MMTVVGDAIMAYPRPPAPGGVAPRGGRAQFERKAVRGFRRSQNEVGDGISMADIEAEERRMEELEARLEEMERERELDSRNVSVAWMATGKENEADFNGPSTANSGAPKYTRPSRPQKSSSMGGAGKKRPGIAASSGTKGGSRRPLRPKADSASSYTAGEPYSNAKSKKDVDYIKRAAGTATRTLRERVVELESKNIKLENSIRQKDDELEAFREKVSALAADIFSD